MIMPGVPSQVIRYALSQAPGPGTSIDLSTAVQGAQFIPAVVRVLTVAGGATILVVGGQDSTQYTSLPGIVVTVRVPNGGSTHTVLGSVRLPSFGTGVGVTALSQRSALSPGFILANTAVGVYK